MQHEMSRCLAAVLLSNLKLVSLDLRLAVEVRNLAFEVESARTAAAVVQLAERLASKHPASKAAQRQQTLAIEQLLMEGTSAPPPATQPAEPEVQARQQSVIVRLDLYQVDIVRYCLAPQREQPEGQAHCCCILQRYPYQMIL